MAAGRFGLTEDDLEKLYNVFERHPQVREVIIYGSRAKGTHRPGSDIDLTIVGDVDWQAFNQLELDLDDLLLPYKIDLSLHEHIDHADLKAHIERVGQTLFCAEQRSTYTPEPARD
ncbi:MAG: nucleotidyltransferase domain-containing protein [Chromatiaceae bacterium]|nr:MAG: nucleotidyltransferase domain-containing protein [Chromatiaceae bacterium]